MLFICAAFEKLRNGGTMFELCNDTLRVHVIGPGEAPNNTFRFDRAGFVSDVIYNR